MTQKKNGWKAITPAKAKKMLKLLKKEETKQREAGKNISLMRRALKARIRKGR
mgnify:CR=1 FL=1